MPVSDSLWDSEGVSASATSGQSSIHFNLQPFKKELIMRPTPYVCYPMRNEERPLILDWDIGQAFYEAKAVVYPGPRKGYLQRPRVVIERSSREWPQMPVVARLVAKPQKYEVGWHHNGNGFDCRRSNLDCVSRAEFQKRIYQSGTQRILLRPKPLNSNTQER